MYRKSLSAVLMVVASVLLAIVLIGLPTANAQDDMTPTVQLGGNDELGSFLVDAQGMTLYLFTKDTPGVSNCSGDCLAKWPPLLVDEGQVPTLAEGVPGRLGVIQRADDSTFQVTYNGMPLYYWVDDAQPGDATGQNVGEVWFVVKTPDVSLGGNADLGPFLVGPNGMTLYLFTKDTPGVSNCSGDCLAKWPPLLIEAGRQPTAQPGLAGSLSMVTRDDGTIQVAYNGWPLYYWVDDVQPGDATGQNVGEVWFVVQPPILSVSSNDTLGNFLVGPDSMTLYLFTKDSPGVTTCYDDCAVKWPPLLVPAAMQLTPAEGVTGTVGVIERTDGTFQVTYNDIPLYYWVRDLVPGDTTGHNVGEVWFVVDPANASLDTMDASTEAPADTSGDAPAMLDGEALVNERCTVCHSRERIDQADKTLEEWEATVDRMISNGAVLNEEERAAVIAYLAETH